MIREGLSIATQVAALIGAVAFGCGALLPLSRSAAWAQAPAGPDGQPAGPPASGIVPISPNSPNNPQNFNPTIGSPVAPVQSQRPAGWPGGPGDDSTAAPTRKAYAPAFGSAGKPAQVANSAAAQPAASRLQFPPLEQMKFEGAEIIAWVGSSPILAADVLYETNKMIDRVLAENAGKSIKPEELAGTAFVYEA